MFLLLLASPVLDIRLAMPDARSDPEGSTTRETYELLAEGFGEGFNGPLLVAVDIGRADPRQVLDNL